MIYIVCLLVIIICNSEMDIISFKTRDSLFQGWWSKKQSLSKLPFIKRTILSFLQDGWHFLKTLVRLSEITLFILCMSPNISILEFIFYTILTYALSGVLFEVFYNRKSILKKIESLKKSN